MRVAIITHYYNSKNYGGNLQAYALCRVLNNMGLKTEQLSYDRYSGRKKRNFRPNGLKKYLNRCITKMMNLRIKDNLKRRNSSIEQFNKTQIPHTETVYDRNSIAQCAGRYEVFITGSDQVWHPIAYCPAYGLEFVPSDKIKLSYAASIAADTISDEYCDVLKKSLSDFSGISVRERNAADIVAELVTIPVQVSLDPTLLLSREEWEEICSTSKIEKPYLFCYFLGNDEIHRRLAEEYAEAQGLIIVTLPYLLGNYRRCDKKFGDEQLYDISPADFIALIKNADMIFTDSFHATVFSIIYEKRFVVFDRAISGSMGSRLSSLMDMLGLRERFCDTAEMNQISYISSLPDSRFDKVKVKIECLKENSLMYLKNSIFGENHATESN